MDKNRLWLGDKKAKRKKRRIRALLAASITARYRSGRQSHSPNCLALAHGTKQERRKKIAEKRKQKPEPRHSDKELRLLSWIKCFNSAMGMTLHFPLARNVLKAFNTSSLARQKSQTKKRYWWGNPPPPFKRKLIMTVGGVMVWNDSGQYKKGLLKHRRIPGMAA